MILTESKANMIFYKPTIHSFLEILDTFIPSNQFFNSKLIVRSTTMLIIPFRTFFRNEKKIHIKNPNATYLPKKMYKNFHNCR